ncbi:T9SS type A sorting domain-containing protein [Flavobacterium sp.]|uniref:T9SS type A sorting domain-containing protein n=1 Tax=Flavobacterium sp. TaxID=239 RepID=UPI00286C87FA|nr:T9SS type A sorting domain-containing protein [Flavobacterium sp.]
MNNIKKTQLLLMLVLCIGFNKVQAQQATLASGGNATGSGGSTSYSIGQIDYITATGSTGSVGQGLQQPFEISTLSGEEFTQIKLQMLVYPNPTTSYVNLKIENYDFQDLMYQLFDINAREISNQKITNIETQIPLENLSSAIYFLKVSENSKIIKTFRILKNN